MTQTPDPNWRQQWQEFKDQAQPPEWIRAMAAHYWKTGYYRPADLRRLLGDPTKGVDVNSIYDFAAFQSLRQTPPLPQQEGGETGNGLK